MPSLTTAEAFDVIKHVRCYGGESGPEHDTLSTGSRTSITTTGRSVNLLLQKEEPRARPIAAILDLTNSLTGVSGDYIAVSRECWGSRIM